MKRGVYIFLGCLFIVIGIVYLAHATWPFTGLFIVDHLPAGQSSLTGIFFLFVGAHFLALTRQRKRGQAAMEFLMTYGWAILASITALSLLAYFGVFGGGNLFGGSSTLLLVAPLTGEGVSINLDYIQMQVRNGASYTINIEGATLTGLPTGVTCNLDETASGIQLPLSLASGATTTLAFLCQDLQEGQKINPEVSIIYTKAGSTLQQSSSGSVSGKVPNTNACPANWHLENGVCVDDQIQGDITVPSIIVLNVNGDTEEPYAASLSGYISMVVATNEDAACRWSENEDLEYYLMSNDCTTDDAQNHLCTKADVAEAGVYDLHISCLDEATPTPNQNTQGNNLDLSVTVFEGSQQQGTGIE